MVERPALEEFRRQINALRRHRSIAPLLKKGVIRLGGLSRVQIAELMKDETAYYFLIAAAGLNRTSLKNAASDETAKIVSGPLRKAFAIETRLPVTAVLFGRRKCRRGAEAR